MIEWKQNDNNLWFNTCNKSCMECDRLTWEKCDYSCEQQEGWDCKECIYNIQMIEERQTIIALGAAAVSKVIFLEEDRLERFPNLKDLTEYVNRIDELIEGKKRMLDTLYGEE